MNTGLLFAKHCDIKDMQEPYQNGLSRNAFDRLIQEYDSIRVEKLVSDAEPIIYDIVSSGKTIKATPFDMLALLINSFPDDKTYEGKATKEHWNKIKNWLNDLIRKAKSR